MEHVAPRRDAERFDCPFCGVCADQRWQPFLVGYEAKGSDGEGAWWGIGHEAVGFAMSVCGNCRQAMLWHGDAPVWPVETSAPAPAGSMPDDVRAAFDEARQVVDRSPRSAAALLRLASLMLCRHLGQPGGIDDALEALVRSGLPRAVRRGLIEARAAGADAVPPGSLDRRDDRATALALFDLVNAIVDKMIAEPALWRPI